MATAEVSVPGGKYITFRLSRQYFAIRSDCVRRIVPAAGVSVLSSRPNFMYGSVPANGVSIPVVDLRYILGLGIRPLRSCACVLVIHLEPECPVHMAGLIADKLSDVLAFRPSEIRGSTAQLRIEGRPYGRPKTLLSPEDLLTPDQWRQLRAVCF